MEINIKDNCCIITPLSPQLEEYETARLCEEISNYPELRTGLDMNYVNDCSIDFIEGINNYKNISLFNLSSDIFAILTSMDLDKKFKLFVSEMDFLSDKHQLINRKFSLV